MPQTPSGPTPNQDSLIFFSRSLELVRDVPDEAVCSLEQQLARWLLELPAQRPGVLALALGWIGVARRMDRARVLLFDAEQHERRREHTAAASAWSLVEAEWRWIQRSFRVRVLLQWRALHLLQGASDAGGAPIDTQMAQQTAAQMATGVLGGITQELLPILHLKGYAAAFKQSDPAACQRHLAYIDKWDLSSNARPVVIKTITNCLAMLEQTHQRPLPGLTRKITQLTSNKALNNKACVYLIQQFIHYNIQIIQRKQTQYSLHALADLASLLFTITGNAKTPSALLTLLPLATDAEILMSRVVGQNSGLRAKISLARFPLKVVSAIIRWGMLILCGILLTPAWILLGWFSGLLNPDDRHFLGGLILAGLTIYGGYLLVKAYPYVTIPWAVVAFFAFFVVRGELGTAVTGLAGVLSKIFTSLFFWMGARLQSLDRICEYPYKVLSGLPTGATPRSLANPLAWLSPAAPAKVPAVLRGRPASAGTRALTWLFSWHDGIAKLMLGFAIWLIAHDWRAVQQARLHDQQYADVITAAQRQDDLGATQAALTFLEGPPCTVGQVRCAQVGTLLSKAAPRALVQLALTQRDAEARALLQRLAPLCAPPQPVATASARRE